MLRHFIEACSPVVIYFFKTVIIINFAIAYKPKYCRNSTKYVWNVVNLGYFLVVRTVLIKGYVKPFFVIIISADLLS